MKKFFEHYTIFILNLLLGIICSFIAYTYFISGGWTITIILWSISAGIWFGSAFSNGLSFARDAKKYEEIIFNGEGNNYTED